MNTEHLVYIPRHAKLVITALAVVVFFLSISIVAYSLYAKVDIGVVSTALTLAQTCAAGLSIIALIFYTKFSVSVDFLRQRTKCFLVEELPLAMNIIEYEEEGFREISGDYRPPKMSSRTITSIKYTDGLHYCQYRVRAYGIDQRIYVQVNVKRMVVSYFLDVDSVMNEDIRKRLDYVVKAAESAGYIYEYEQVHDNAEKNVTVQLRLFRSLDEEFLMNSGERLYVANDFASMTRALMRALPVRKTEAEALNRTIAESA